MAALMTNQLRVRNLKLYIVGVKRNEQILILYSEECGDRGGSR